MIFVLFLLAMNLVFVLFIIIPLCCAVLLKVLTCFFICCMFVDIRIMSSMYIMAGTKNEPNLTPVFVFCILFKSCLVYIAYKSEERLDPCLIPALVFVGIDVSEPIVMLYFVNLYVDMIALSSLPSMPASCSEFQSMFRGTLSYAFEKSKDVRIILR